MAFTPFSGSSGDAGALNTFLAQLFYLRELISDPSYTAATPKMAFTAAGNLVWGGSVELVNAVRCVSVVAPAGDRVALALQTTPTTPIQQVLEVWNAATSGNNGLVTFITEGGGTQRGSIDFNRSGVAVRYNTTSDVRLKESIVDAPDAGALVDAIRVRSFVWRETGSAVEHGFIAQELAEVVPDAVKAGDGGETVEDVWGVDPSKLVALLVRELQSLRLRVAALEAA